MRYLPILFLYTLCLPPQTAGAADPWMEDNPPPVRGVQPINETLHRLIPGEQALQDHYGALGDHPEILLSKSVYPAEDRYLDAVILRSADAADTGADLTIRMTDADGDTLYEEVLPTPKGAQVFLSALLPPVLAGGSGFLEIAWAGQSARAEFQVDAPAPPPAAGRIQLDIPNPSGAEIDGLPITVGVPFPRGALWTTETLRLRDADGHSIPMQAEVTGRWARFGPIKWLRCSFTIDLYGDPRTLYLEYGHAQQEPAREPIAVKAGDAGFPAINAGSLRMDDGGMAYRADGSDAWVPALDKPALHGGFVVREGGTRYTMDARGTWEVEEHGSERVVLLTQGYFQNAANGDTFCRYHTRYYIYRDSPVLRIVHTWIFTGDGNRDRIVDMGWRFDVSDKLRPEGFMLDFAEPHPQPGLATVQTWHDAYVLWHDDADATETKGRLPGVASVHGDSLRMTLGVQEFWQNFPSELELGAGALTFYNWPRRGREARYSPATVDNAWRLAFAHEGDLLDFRLPDEYVTWPFWKEMSRERPASSHYALENIESANAQGIARTEEMFLYLGDAGQSYEALANIMRGLADETLRAVVDPVWMAASGAFHEMHPRDPVNFPEEEAAFDQLARAPMRWLERMGHYGMWVHGDMLSSFNLNRQTSSLYRTRRKGHHAWPYPWIPYARSGDADLFRMAKAATRQMTDANYSHYVSPEVEAATGPEYTRGKGFWHRSLVPWTGRYNPVTRDYSERCTYLWHAYYLADDAWARDVALDFAEASKITEDRPMRGRISPTSGGGRADVALLKSYTEMYQATFDPWFLVTAQAIARGRQERRVGLLDGDPITWDALYSQAVTDMPGYNGLRHRDFWHAGDRDYHRFTGDPAHAKLNLDRATEWTLPRWVGFSHWAAGRIPMWEQAAYGYHLSGDPFYLRRIEHYMDMLRAAQWQDREFEFLYGTPLHSAERFTGWSLHHYPQALHALYQAGHRLPAIPSLFVHRNLHPPTVAIDGATYHAHAPEILVYKESKEKLPLFLGVTPHSQVFALTRDVQEGEYWHYLIEGPNGWEQHDSWPLGREHLAVIPADAPAGVYRLQVAHADTASEYGLMVPVSPPDTPEVMVLPAGEVHSAGEYLEAQYWFHVPEDLHTFTLEVAAVGPRNARFAVWDADGKLAWDVHNPGERFHTTVEIDVPPGQGGRLWRITSPVPGFEFRMDEAIPPYFAAGKTRWFSPGNPPDSGD